MDKQTYPLLYVTLADALSAQGKQADAIKAYHSAIAMRPNYGEAHYRLGLMFFTLAENAVSQAQRKELAAFAKVRIALRRVIVDF